MPSGLRAACPAPHAAPFRSDLAREGETAGTHDRRVGPRHGADPLGRITRLRQAGCRHVIFDPTRVADIPRARNGSSLAGSAAAWWCARRGELSTGSRGDGRLRVFLRRIEIPAEGVHAPVL